MNKDLPKLNPDHKEPSTVNISEGNRKYYKELQGTGLLKGTDNPRLFMISMAIGFMDGEKKELGKRYAYTRPEPLKEKEKCIIKAIAACGSDYELDVIANKKEMYSIAEQYAENGIDILTEMNKSHGSFSKKLEHELTRVIDEVSAELQDTIEEIHITSEEENVKDEQGEEDKEYQEDREIKESQEDKDLEPIEDKDVLEISKDVILEMPKNIKT